LENFYVAYLLNIALFSLPSGWAEAKKFEGLALTPTYGLEQFWNTFACEIDEKSD